jgi:hypothetical protein
MPFMQLRLDYSLPKAKSVRGSLGHKGHMSYKCSTQRQTVCVCVACLVSSLRNPTAGFKMIDVTVLSELPGLGINLQ